ncbi:MAG: hypothetical protein MUP45_03980 [Candidatus Marinimicrobia bacterium]|nr:hypothetical protein [Candidatus Neomarinimicrobiota bacterium]
MKKKIVKIVNPDLMERIFGIIMAIILVIGGLLYWRGDIEETGLILIGVVVLIAGVSFIIGIRVSQADGFLDGYVRAKNHFDGKKK